MKISKGALSKAKKSEERENRRMDFRVKVRG